MSVTLREKKIKGGKISFYLDIYHHDARWTEFLKIHINASKPTPEDKEKRRLASEIRASREHELIVEDNGLIDKRKREVLFLPYFDKHYKIFKQDGTRNLDTNNSRYSTYKHLRDFIGQKPIFISRITTNWMEDLKEYLVGKVSNNTALTYLKLTCAVLNQAVRDKIIPRNPWQDVPKKQKLKHQKIFRAALTFEQIEMLAQMPFKWELQIKQGYLFSCFTGLRWSDWSALKWSEIVVRKIEGVDRWFMYFEQEKTDDIEYLPLTEQAIDILRERKSIAEKEGDKSPFVFPKLKETNCYKKPVQRLVIKKLKLWVKAARKFYGEDKFTITEQQMKPHTARHTFASNMLETGAQGDLLLVSKLLGHKSINSTLIYAHIREQRKLNAVAAFPKVNLKPAHSANKAAA